MASLVEKSCVPCRGGVPPLDEARVTELLAELSDWTVVDGHHLSKSYALADFAAALALVNKLGEVAERQGHHPNIYLAWGRVRVDIWTHAIDGLTESDFILAAKIDAI